VYGLDIYKFFAHGLGLLKGIEVIYRNHAQLQITVCDIL
jgi:hypothetical protein